MKTKLKSEKENFIYNFNEPVAFHGSLLDDIWAKKIKLA